MTYNWNNMVSITVPTGTNGWLYSGEVIINGVKVRFPVGVPTSVPEPAAVLLKKMIELEQEEDANTAKPQNHYVGSVTIPAGKTLTLEKGSKFVDNSGPSEVVILPETEMTYNEEEGSYVGNAQSLPEGGKTYIVTYNGTEYDCLCAAQEIDPGVFWLILGNSDALDMGVSGGNPNAPFVVICTQGSEDVPVMVVPMDGATSVTLSIVQTEGAASGGESAGGGVVVATGTIQDDGTIASADKTYAELLAAHNAGKYVLFKATSQYATTVLPLVMHITYGNEYLAFGVNIDTQKLTAKAALLYYADGKIEYTSA